MGTVKPKVLLVDDVPENLEILLHILQPRGYAILVAEDGPSALKVAAHALPDLILLDIMMPGMDGLEVCRRLAADPATSDIPIIFLSALHDMEWKMKGFEAGGVDYVSKPYWECEVLARVGTHVRLRAAQKELAQANEALSQANRRLKDLAAEDGLTGIPNRRRLDEHLTMSWAQCAREGMPLSVIMGDVDCFKAYNDRYGHQAGDEVLRRVAHTIREVLKRPADLAGRYGGEEFMLILFNTDPAGALVVAQEVQTAIHQLAIPHEASTAGPFVSLSIGVASALPGRSSEPPRPSNQGALITLADEALYEAKHSGRNCSVLYPA